MLSLTSTAVCLRTKKKKKKKKQLLASSHVGLIASGEISLRQRSLFFSGW